MAPLEVNACGRPVIAYGAGGAFDTVIDGVTGVLAEPQSVDAFVRAIRRLEATPFDSQMLGAHAQNFSIDEFVAKSANTWNWNGSSIEVRAIGLWETCRRE